MSLPSITHAADLYKPWHRFFEFHHRRSWQDAPQGALPQPRLTAAFSIPTRTAGMEPVLIRISNQGGVKMRVALAHGGAAVDPLVRGIVKTSLPSAATATATAALRLSVASRLSARAWWKSSDVTQACGLGVGGLLSGGDGSSVALDVHSTNEAALTLRRGDLALSVGQHGPSPRDTRLTLSTRDRTRGVSLMVGAHPMDSGRTVHAALMQGWKLSQEETLTVAAEFAASGVGGGLREDGGMGVGDCVRVGARLQSEGLGDVLVAADSRCLSAKLGIQLLPGCRLNVSTGLSPHAGRPLATAVGMHLIMGDPE